MDRKSKAEYLKKLFAGQMAPADLLLLLPRRAEFWIQSKDGTFSGMTRAELDNHRSGQDGIVHRYVITRRGRGNRANNESTKSESTD